MAPNPKDLSEREACEVAMGLAQRLMRGEIIGQTRYAAECAVAVEVLVNTLMASRNGGETDAATPPPACADQWRDIASAPRDGTHFLGREETGDIYRAAFHRDGYIMSFCGQPVVRSPEPTHWMSIPQGPSVDRDGLARDRSEPAEPVPLPTPSTDGEG